MSKQFLIEFLQGNKDSILSKISGVSFHGKSKENFDFVTVVPKYGRDNHLRFLIDCFKKRQQESEFSHRMVVVEHGENKEALSYCESHDVDYIFIPKSNELFNKCLAMNVGSFLHNSKYLHFHDIDLFMPSMFWKKIQINLKGKVALQTFTRRRVNYINESYSNDMFNGKIGINEIISKRHAWHPGKPGAPGGSVIIKRDLFNEIGGFDPCYFLSYSIEDQFFVDKIQTISKFHSSDSPPIELFHLWHPSNEKATPIDVRKKGLKVRDYFIRLNSSEKKSLIEMYSSFLVNQREKFNEIVR